MSYLDDVRKKYSDRPTLELPKVTKPNYGSFGSAPPGHSENFTCWRWRLFFEDGRTLVSLFCPEVTEEQAKAHGEKYHGAVVMADPIPGDEAIEP